MAVVLKNKKNRGCSQQLLYVSTKELVLVLQDQIIEKPKISKTNQIIRNIFWKGKKNLYVVLCSSLIKQSLVFRKLKDAVSIHNPSKSLVTL